MNIFCYLYSCKSIKYFEGIFYFCVCAFCYCKNKKIKREKEIGADD